MFAFRACALALLFSSLALAAPVPPAAAKRALSDQLVDIRKRVIHVERGMIDGLRTKQETQSNLKRLQELMRLQAQERSLTQQRLQQLQSTVTDLEGRRNGLREKIGLERAIVRGFMKDLQRASSEIPAGVRPDQREKVEAARRKVLSLLVERGLKELEALRVDLADADQLESKIEEERQQLAYLANDLKEQEGMLEFNRQIHVDVLKKRHDERLTQLENYRKLKEAESQVTSLITEFNSRKELEKAVETERQASRAMATGSFGKLKGTLSLPVAGAIVTRYGKGLDPVSKLQVFRKGIEIAAGKGAAVRAISEGKVAFSGELPNYGRVTILDHGNHYYSICANLGELKRKAGDLVKSGDELGVSDSDGKPVYFEIRARNLPTDPAEWVRAGMGA